MSGAASCTSRHVAKKQEDQEGSKRPKKTRAAPRCIPRAPLWRHGIGGLPLAAQTLRLLKAASPGPMKALATAFRGEDAAHTHATGLSTHDIHSTGFGFPIPAAVVAVIAFGHVVTALFVYGLHLCGG